MHAAPSMRRLDGKVVLFIGIGFYDYESAIADELRRLGATVIFHHELPGFVTRRPVAPFIQRFNLDVSYATRTHQSRILAHAEGTSIDYVLVINGEHLAPSFLRALRSSHPSATFIAYYWDALARFPKLLETRTLFDRAYTSDREDAQAVPSLHFRPLFFRPDASVDSIGSSAMPFDLSFIGWLHHDRLEQVSSLAAYAKENALNAFFYLYAGMLTYLQLRMQRQAEWVHVRTMSYRRNAAVTAASRVVVDLPHPMQSGMTMRAIEAVGAGKKIITTARDIVIYDFFRQENILVVDPDTMRVDPAFLQVAPAPVDPLIVSRYSLASWVSDIFELAVAASPRTA